jgi:two-component system, OmpR family, KDP operon response regulator KdpE
MTNSQSPVILIVDDEAQIRRLLQRTLEPAGYTVRQAASGEEATVQAGMESPDCLILDLGLPDTDGMDVLAKLRAWAQFPIIILSVRDSEQDIIKALDGGADDYLTKPFHTGELLARVRTAIRHRHPPGETELYTFGTLTVDLTAHTVKKNGSVLRLTTTEYDLLSLLVRNAGKVLTHNFILEQVWGHAYSGETQYTRVYVGQLRKKIEDDPANPTLILTESGIGYRLAENKT